MSVILALVSRRDAVVASDGREFGSAELDVVTGRVLQRAPVATDDFDKTFVLFGGKVVAAFAGLTRFGGRTVGEHIIQIVGKGGVAPPSLADVGNAVKEELIARLSSVSPDEVLPDSRKVDVLLAGGAQLTRHDFQIWGLRFQPADDCAPISCEQHVQPYDKRQLLRYGRFGDDDAVRAVDACMASNASSLSDREFMLDLATRAIEAGIAVCGIHPNGDAPSCGGKVFWKQSWYTGAKP